MAQGLTVPNHYLYIMPIFYYDASDRRMQWKRKNKSHLEKALDKATSFFFSAPKLHSIIGTKLPPTLTNYTGHERRMPVEIILWEEADVQDSRHKTIIKWTLPVDSTHVRGSPFVHLPVAIKKALALTHPLAGQRREHQRHLEKGVSNTFLADFLCLQKSSPETLSIMECGMDDKMLPLTWCARQHAGKQHSRAAASSACSTNLRQLSCPGLLQCLPCDVPPRHGLVHGIQGCALQHWRTNCQGDKRDRNASYGCA